MACVCVRVRACECVSYRRLGGSKFVKVWKCTCGRENPVTQTMCLCARRRIGMLSPEGSVKVARVDTRRYAWWVDAKLGGGGRRRPFCDLQLGLWYTGLQATNEDCSTTHE